MAIAFNGTTQYVYKAVSGMPVTFPVSMFVRCMCNVTTDEGYPFQVLNNAIVDGNYTPGFRGDRVGDPLVFRRGYPGSTDTLLSSGTFTAGQWITYGAVARSATDASQYINGVRANSSANVPFPGLTDVAHGIFNVGSNSFGAPFNGAMCHAALWRVTLTDEEFASLHKGFSPRRIRPKDLRYYVPGIRLVQDRSGGDAVAYSGSYGNTTTPRVFGI